MDSSNENASSVSNLLNVICHNGKRLHDDENIKKPKKKKKKLTNILDTDAYLLGSCSDNDDNIISQTQEDEAATSGNLSSLDSKYHARINHRLESKIISNLQGKYKLCNNQLDIFLDIHKLKYFRRVEQCDKDFTPTSNYTLNKSNVLDIEQLNKIFGIIPLVARNFLDTNDRCDLSCLQNSFLSIFTQYTSLYYPCKDLNSNSVNLPLLYCTHVVNHIMKSRVQLLKNNEKLSKLTPDEIDNIELKDRGLVRPKVLILLPFKDKALQVIDLILTLLNRGKKFQVNYKKRLYEEFKEKMDEDEVPPDLSKKPTDYKELFSGNTDEHFRVGMSVLGNSVRLYSPFYSSDIIVASPLGLRTIIGEKGEQHYEYDFLSSIEIVVADNSDVFLMQNWDHLLHIFKHLHVQPNESHDTDFSRVYDWALDGHAKHYCQFLIFSSISHPQIASLPHKYCYNYNGLIVAEPNHHKGTMCQIPLQLPQIFQRVSVETYATSFEVRFKHFIDEILQKYKKEKLSNTLVYVPQYYDFVRIRNHMRKEYKEGSGPKFGFISEYSESKTVGKARRNFLMGKMPFLLYSERYHFYHRPFLKGIKHLIFYELPTYSHFYSEMCNMIRPSSTSLNSTDPSVIAVFNKFDGSKLSPIIGYNRCNEVLKSSKNVHVFVTGTGTGYK